MSKKFLIGALTVVAAGAVALAWSARSDLKYLASQLGSDQSRWFTEVAPPLREDHHLFDLGVVDADGDGRLDVYTSNHNFRQQLLLALPQGGHRDVLTTWGLDQNRDFPAWEQSFAAPPTDRPGLYVYWLGDVLTLRTVGLKGLQPVSGTIRMFSKIEVKSSLGFTQRTETGTVPDSTVKQTTLHFSASDDGVLELVPPSRGVPTQIEIAGDFPLKHVHIGGQRANPAGRSFSPYLRDRHAMAWADLDGDGRLDLFISRGGVGGTLRMLPAAVRDGIRDELLLSGGQPPYADLSTARGIQKKDCSGRHARWVDFDGDGRLDLFVNCQNRGKAKGEFPKQLWQQGADGRFTDVAQAVGLGLTDGEIIDFAWIDVDGDGLVDLVTNEDRGFFVYRHRRDGAAHRFEAELVHRPEFVRADVEGLAAEVNNFWRFDGRLAVADADGDGDLDVFASSKHGNVLLVNDGGRLKPVPPADWGLPAKSLNATWVDTDNDGRPDLHTLPDGLYRQTAPGRFSATGLLSATPLMYQAAIVHWYDFDGDGRRDLFQALNENPALWRWWQKPTRTRDDEFLWRMAAWRNTAPARHWLQLDLVGGPGNRQAIGAQVTVTTPAGRQLQVVGLNDGAYFSQGHYRLYFGLGDQARVQRLSVRTGDGRSLELTDVAADRRLTIDLGAATAAR